MGVRISHLLIASGAILAAVLYSRDGGGPDPPPPLSDARTIASEAIVRPLATPRLLPPLGVLSATIARPLFAQSRRPPPRPQQPVLPPAPPGALDRYLLIGVVSVAERRWALLQEAYAPEVLTLEAGASLEGWTLDRILDDRVIFAHPAGRYEMPLGDADRPPPRLAAAGSLASAAPASPPPPGVIHKDGGTVRIRN